MSFFSVELRYWQVPADVSSSTRGTNSWCKLLNHTFFQFKRVLFLSTATMDFFIFTFVHKITFRETSPTHWFKYFSLLFQVSDTLVVSGCEGGKVKVWDIERACLLKVRTFFFKTFSGSLSFIHLGLHASRSPSLSPFKHHSRHPG